MTYAMEASRIAVEAASLSAITDIASNPPSHPQAPPPSSIPQLPLILYIARVPGSRDVFLTPIKPRDRTVTAEDVHSSLYYVHVNDEEHQDPPPRPSSVNTDASHLLPIPRQGIRRKPTLPRRPVSQLPPLHPMANGMPSAPSLTSQLPRKPVRPVSDHRYKRVDLPVLPPRPLPTLPQDDEPYEESLHANTVHLLRYADHSEDNNPYVSIYEPIPPPINPADLPEPGSLTLIRRDPSMGDQWNVATMHDPPIREVSSAAVRNPTAAQRAKRGGAPLYLDISNPGYLQFLDPEWTQSRQSADSTSSDSSDPPPDGVFRRRLYMPGSKYGEHSYATSRHSRFGSVASIDSYNDEAPSMRSSMRDSVSYTTESQQPSYSDRRSKGYTFTTPWSTRCEFLTGATGRTLKCKHYNSASQPSSSVEVSELRFNLPTSSSKTGKTSLADKRSSYLHHRAHSSSEDGSGSVNFVFDDQGRIDLSLGREKAGGGFGGKQAKLGKLIIQPDGLGMLDLLVAANLGLWWRAWGR